MSSKIICAGNWKLNHGVEATRSFLSGFAEAVSADDMKDFALFLPALTMSQLSGDSRFSKLNWGAQNIYWETSGAFTGENSPEVLKEMGATHALVGHSERRSLFGETNEDTNKKMLSLASQGLTPVLCLGETLDQRKSGKTLDVICEQLRVGLKDWNADQLFWLAYEPVWAIGTGEVATPEQAEEAHAALRKELTSLLPSVAESTPILYGGSVKPGNAKELGEKPNVNGFLVGGASLKVDSFVDIWKQGLAGKG